MRIQQSAITGFSPMIAMTPDWECDPASPSEARYVLRINYAAALEQAGALPVVLTYAHDLINEIVARFDGFVITGTTPGVSAMPGRTEFECALIDAALAAEKPVLGICNGMQMIGLSLGARLIERLDPAIPDALNHLPQPIPTAAAHSIRLSPESRLAKLAHSDVASVNSLHRQAIEPGGRFRVVATAPDGVVEAIEGYGPGYVLGTQWHPEYQLTEFDRALFADFVAAARQKV